MIYDIRHVTTYAYGRPVPFGRCILRVMPRDALVEQQVLDKLPEEYRALFVKCLRLIVEPQPPRERPAP